MSRLKLAIEQIVFARNYTAFCINSGKVKDRLELGQSLSVDLSPCRS
jgi:hypothetical protein